MDTPFETCAKRILKREDHPTQVTGTNGVNILEKFKQMFKLPNYDEGFERILSVKPQEIDNCNEDDIKEVMRKLDEIPKRVVKQERGGRKERGKGRPYRGGFGNHGRANSGNYQGENYGGSSSRGDAWGNRGRGGNRGRARGNYQGENYAGNGDRGDPWRNRGRGTNNNSKNVANPHYNSNFPPLGEK